MKYFNIVLMWIGKSWLAPAIQIKIEGLGAASKEAAKAKAAAMFLPNSWKITEVVEL